MSSSAKDHEPRRRSRRAVRPPAPGSDPHPLQEPFLTDKKLQEDAWREGDSSNDERLLGDRPPHWAQKEKE